MSEIEKLMPKAYEASQVEDKIYAAWEKSGYFTPENLPNVEKRQESFCIVLPPPNVTGTLHMGHAVMLAIEDAMVRFARLQGKNTLWLPGTDHAAIATQTKVEKLLMSEGMKDPRRELGREKFLARVEKFASESHDTIVGQIKKLGASVDWTREAYTLDEARNLAVRSAFKRMYDDGLIYRGSRVINWCPRCKSTLADDEVEHKENVAKLYTFKYDHNFPIAISTTRPETKLGDTAVAVNPSDKRYKKFIGQEFKVDFAGGPLNIKIIGNQAVDATYGTGALGVTPAHSKIDEDMARENKLSLIKVIDENGRMTDLAGKDFTGLTVLEAREKVVDWLTRQGLMMSVEDAPQNLSVCYRCSESIEPLPKTQWFIDVNKEFAFHQSERHPISGLLNGESVTLKKLMQHAVRSGEIKILPDRFNKTYFHWIDNLRDWNISRQIWFGHRLPVWYKGEEIFVGVEAPAQQGWTQDTDTLDTWFSSGLWTFTTLGWPNEQAHDLMTYHPTSVLETGYDILFFWVARMILMTTYFLGEVPFKTVYLHGIVRDEQGRKMSKSLGNVIDPLTMIEKFGADATRLSLLIGATPGNDTRLSEEKIAGFRNFTNKLWNIARFVFMSVEKIEAVDAVEAKTLADKWILGRLSKVIDQVTKYHETYEYSLLGECLRDFTWGEFADWYIEIAKVQKAAGSEMAKNTDQILLYVLERLLRLWHPLMPFVTEEIYTQFDRGMIIVADWPEAKHKLSKTDLARFEQMQNFVVAVRNIRAQYKISPKQSLSVVATLGRELAESDGIIKALAKVDNLTFDEQAKKPAGSAQATLGDKQIFVLLSGVVDLDKEKSRLGDELAQALSYMRSLESKLSNSAFVNKAPEEVVAQEKEKLSAVSERVATLQKTINDLKL